MHQRGLPTEQCLLCCHCKSFSSPYNIGAHQYRRLWDLPVGRWRGFSVSISAAARLNHSRQQQSCPAIIGMGQNYALITFGLKDKDRPDCLNNKIGGFQSWYLTIPVIDNSIKQIDAWIDYQVGLRLKTELLDGQARKKAKPDRYGWLDGIAG